ncbi:MAG TPA: sarcosine oxidase subunit gamma family protein [Steroidobacteraceae bacterium]|jgi:sarcosine oxidase subunit gamma
MRAEPTGITTSAFEGLPTAVGSGRGVIGREIEGLGIARIAAGRGQAARVSQLVRGQFGLEPPNAPRRASHGDFAIAGVSPCGWLATRDHAGNELAPSLQSLLGGCASVVDQSDAYGILRLTGPKVRETLAKMIPLDIHPRSFQVSAVAQTVCGYVNVMLWRLEDTAQGDPVFETWVGRSLAVSLHQAIAHGATEFGFTRQPAGERADSGGPTA